MICSCLKKKKKKKKKTPAMSYSLPGQEDNIRNYNLTRTWVPSCATQVVYPPCVSAFACGKQLTKVVPIKIRAKLIWCAAPASPKLSNQVERLTVVSCFLPRAYLPERCPDFARFGISQSILVQDLRDIPDSRQEHTRFRRHLVGA